jgi:transcriptional regulator with XRE-family HTH domain
VSDLTELQKFLDDSYRESYLDSHVKGGIAYQIQALREKEGLNQTKFGSLVGMPQPVVSRLENTEYGAVNVNTLLKIANALKIGLEVRFCNFETVLSADMSPVAFRVENIQETLVRCVRAAIPSPPPSNEIQSSGAAGQRVIGGSTGWQTSQIPNQPPSLEVFPGSGTRNFVRPMPTQASSA